MDFNIENNFHSPEELDLLTLIEPLACVQHAYRRLPETLIAESAVVFGAGPIGSLHVIELQKRYPGLRIRIVDPSPARRALARKIFQGVSAGAGAPDEKSDLTVVATSEPYANLSAIQATKPMGTVIHFSGLNHKSKSEPVEYEGIQIEKVHRNEEVRVLSNGIRLVGSSGYSRSDIARSLKSLRNDPRTYSQVQTSAVDGIDSTLLIRKDGTARAFTQSVVTTLLKSDDEYLNDLKVVFRVNKEDPALQVSPTAAEGAYLPRILEQELKAPVRAGYVRLQVLRFSICNTDRRVLDGTKEASVSDSFILGHEGIGTIIETGDGVDIKLRENDIALILPHFYESSDPLLKNGVPYLSLKLKHLGIHINGCFAKFVDVPVQCVFPIAPGLTAQREQETQVAS